MVGRMTGTPTQMYIVMAVVYALIAWGILLGYLIGTGGKG
jgi:hypothetical protein